VTAAALHEDQAQRIRERIAEAVFDGPEDLRAALETEPASYLTLIAAAHVAAGEANRLLHDSVTGARHAGHSWDAIGGLLGVSRQAAQQRFKTGVGETPDDPARRVITGVTAFNELAALERAGRAGFHLVDFGAFYLVVEASDRQWEHRRTIAPSRGAQRRLEDEGWQPAGTWFPFRYYARPLDAAPVAGDDHFK
jgi:hypothetical protein